MLVSLARTAFLGIALVSGTDLAFAGDLDDFNAAAEQVGSHNRVAIGYLRTGNADLASIELDRLRDAWTSSISNSPANGRRSSRTRLFP